MESTTIKTTDWIIVYIILMIPVVNIVMLFVWAFGSATPASKANFARASLILFAITVALYIIAAMSFGFALLDAFTG